MMRTVAFLFIVRSALCLSTESAPPRLRFLEEQQQQDGDGQGWQGYGATIKYEKCFSDGNGNDKVFFLMCPAQSGCVSQCQYGKEYISDLGAFVKAFTRAQYGKQEEQAEEEEEQDDFYAEAADDAAVAGDDAAADDAAAEQAQDDDVVEDGTSVNFLRTHYECTAFGDYYIAPYCSNYNIYLGLYTDNACTQLAQDNYFYTLTGYNLPYSLSSNVAVTGIQCAPCDGSGGQQQEEDEEQAADDAAYGDDDANAVTYDVSQCQAVFGTAQEREDSGTIVPAKNYLKIPAGIIVGGILVAGVLFVAFIAFAVGYYDLFPLKEKNKALLPEEYGEQAEPEEK